MNTLLHKKIAMRKLMIIFVALLCTFLSAEQYQIRSFEYEIDGRTREDVISQAVYIHVGHIFSSLQELEQYFAGRETLVEQLRTLESIVIIPTYGFPDEQNIIPVDLLVKVKDSWNIIPVPYPKYDSNTGTEFKLKILDYNFLGLMRTLDSEILYQHDTDGDKDDHIFGGSVSFALPFNLGPFSSSWSTSLSLGYTLGDDYPNASFSTGLSFHYPLNYYMGLNLTLAQGITYDPDYREWGDALYFTESAWLSLPVYLARNEFLGWISWTPNISVIYYWDPDGINPANTGLIDTDIGFGHTLSSYNIQWVGNFRDGLYLSVGQSLHKETHHDQFYISNSLTAQYFKAFEHVQIASQLHLFHNRGNVADIGHRIRGISTSGARSDAAIVVNFDLPIRVWDTDWVGYGLWGWTEWADFELQLSPFIDIAIGNNPLAGTNFDLKDGWYAAGLEVLVYPKKMRSLIGRISFGVDAVGFAERVGYKIPFVAKIVDKLFNTHWRTGSWYELTFSIGVFY